VIRLLSAIVAASALRQPVGARTAAEIERLVDVPRPGRVVVALDSDVYDAARADLSDLRVIDEAGQEVPFLLDRPPDELEEDYRPAHVMERRPAPGPALSATLDFGSPFLKRDLVLSLGGDQFRRRVTVEGRYRFEHEWALLADRFVFALADPPARYETVPLTESNHQFLRVTVHGGPGETTPADLLEAASRPRGRRRPREVALTPTLKRERDAAAHQTVLTLDLGGRHQPYLAVVFEVAGAEFVRGATVEAWDQGHPSVASAWRPLADGALYRIVDGPETHEGLRLDAAGRGRLLRVRLHDGDETPLDVRQVGIRVPVEHLVFEAEVGHRYRLSYGRGDRRAPSYEIHRTVGDAAVWIAQAAEAYLGPPRRPPSAISKLPFWRHPLSWVGGVFILIVASALAGRRVLHRRRAARPLAPRRGMLG
jgi:hypothetical protein